MLWVVDVLAPADGLAVLDARSSVGAVMGPS